MKTNKKNKPPDETQIPWHPAFIEALQLELDAYKDVLEFKTELQLTTEPLRIDCVVIKKIKEVEIKKNIGKIFRTWNIIEYKSPDDYVSVNDFYKVYGYACFYKHLEEIPITDLTITFVESHYPKELIKHLRKIRGYTVAETSSGVYNINGDILPIQIIDNRRLLAEDSVWLKNLDKDLSFSDIDQVSSMIAQQGKSARIGAYANAIKYANFKTIMEKNMTLQEIDKTFFGWLDEIGYGELFMAKLEERERQKWTQIIAEKEAKLADKDAQIARLQAELEKRK